MLKGIKYCQLSDNDLGMNLPAYTTSYTTKQTDSRSTTNVKGMEKKHNLFVEVNLSNGRLVYTRKTTLVWLLQRQSSDTF